MSATPVPPVGYRPAHPMPAQRQRPPERSSAADAVRSGADRDRNVRDRSAEEPVRDRFATDDPNAPWPGTRKSSSAEVVPDKPVKKVRRKGRAKTRRADKLASFSARFRRSTEEPVDDELPITTEELERDDFDVPPIGGTPSVGKSRQAMMRLGVPMAILVTVGGGMYSCGVSTGSSRIPAAGSISQDEAVRFRLSSFPAEQAAAFGQRYLEICLSPPAGTDAASGRERLDLLAQMATSGTDTGCGYSGTVSADAVEPRSISFTGEMRSLKDYPEGAAAFLTFQVTWSDTRLVNAVVPVWVDDRTNPTAMRVVGNLGFMPVNKLGAPPPHSETRTKDSTLAGQLQQSVLTPFLQAWGSSDAQQLGLVLTDDATFNAREGLRGVLTDPTVTSAMVFTPHTNEGSQIRYADGDEVITETAVQWFSTIAAAKQSAVYQIRLRLVQGKWSVIDISGSAIDPTGGPVQDDGRSAPATSTGHRTTTTSAPHMTQHHDPAEPTLPPADN